MEKIICEQCKLEINKIDLFSKRKIICKKCNNKNHYEKNKLYYISKGDKRRKDPNSIPKIRGYNKEWMREKRKIDACFRLQGNLRNRLRDFIKGRRRSKTTEVMLGCAFQEYKIYVESLWTQGMNWDNYGREIGKWNIDHIKPLSLFNLTDREDQIKAFNFKNTQPLWSSDNSRKKDTYIEN